ncbi:MAG: sugar-transfer associated ATP-grasp domain-containing protein, partial [Propionibacteriaceae bacterium]|nr:sugar-transfer associated ATP-grasp domain-containing protein [Propionibacteriaceae bacterium]
MLPGVNLRFLPCVKLRKHYSRLRAIARVERKSAHGNPRPSLWLLGFYSDKAWRYPEGLRRQSHLYVSDWAAETRTSRLNPPEVRDLLRDKVSFAHHLAAHGLAQRAPRHLGEIRAGELWLEPGARGWGAGVVVKPRRGAGGSGVRVFCDLASVESALARGDLVDSVVQERVNQHDEIARIFPGVLHTIRILALRARAGSEDEVLVPAAAHRFGARATGVVDNAAAGGLVARVDVAHGVLSSLVIQDPRGRRRLADSHPDTGTPVAGVTVPFWPEAKRLVVDLMNTLPDAVHIGWDIAIGP